MLLTWQTPVHKAMIQVKAETLVAVVVDKHEVEVQAVQTDAEKKVSWMQKNVT